MIRNTTERHNNESYRSYRNETSLTRGVRRFTDLTNCFAQNYISYRERGLSDDRCSGLRFDWIDLVRPTYHFQVVEQKKSIASIGLVPDSGLGLPSDCAFPNELDFLRDRGVPMAEATKMSGDQATLNSHRAVSLLMAQVFKHAYYYGYQTIIATVNPRHKNFWVKKFGFKVVSTVPACPHVEGAEGVLIRKTLHSSKPDYSVEKYSHLVTWHPTEVPSAHCIATDLDLGLIIAGETNRLLSDDAPPAELTEYSGRFEGLSPFLKQACPDSALSVQSPPPGPYVSAAEAASLFLHLLSYRAQSQKKELVRSLLITRPNSENQVGLFLLMHSAMYINRFFDALPANSRVEIDIHTPASLSLPTLTFRLSGQLNPEPACGRDWHQNNEKNLRVAFLHAQKILQLGGTVFCSQNKMRTVEIVLPLAAAEMVQTRLQGFTAGVI